jgi:hypothetical protein
MQSHTCQLQTKDWAWLLLGPLAALLLLSVLLHLGTWTGKLPPPRSTHDPDETILVHQADASRARSVARLILCGDSSCLMDVEARLLGDLLGAECLNLGTFSYLDLNAATWLVQEFNKANPGQLACAVVLMHPDPVELPAGPTPSAMARPDGPHPIRAWIVRTPPSCSGPSLAGIILRIFRPLLWV